MSGYSKFKSVQLRTRLCGTNHLHDRPFLFHTHYPIIIRLLPNSVASPFDPAVGCSFRLFNACGISVRQDQDTLSLYRLQFRHGSCRSNNSVPGPRSQVHTVRSALSLCDGRLRSRAYRHMLVRNEFTGASESSGRKLPGKSHLEIPLVLSQPSRFQPRTSRDTIWDTLWA